MPSHALPPGPERRARRTQARARQWRHWRRRQWRDQLPLYLVLVTGAQVAGLPPADADNRGILDLIGTIVGAVAFILVFMLVLAPVYLRAEALRQRQAAPRPRWQYLVFAVGWGALAGGLGRSPSGCVTGGSARRYGNGTAAAG
jgi:uncharacterized membrane protein YfcA